MMLASKAEPKSREKWWIFSFKDRFMSVMSQFMRSCSINVGITVSLTEHFWSRARQNRWITDPWSWSFRILIKNHWPWQFGWSQSCSFSKWYTKLPGEYCRQCLQEGWWHIWVKKENTWVWDYCCREDWVRTKIYQFLQFWKDRFWWVHRQGFFSVQELFEGRWL